PSPSKTCQSKCSYLILPEHRQMLTNIVNNVSRSKRRHLLSPSQHPTQHLTEQTILRSQRRIILLQLPKLFTQRRPVLLQMLNVSVKPLNRRLPPLRRTIQARSLIRPPRAPETKPSRRNHASETDQWPHDLRPIH